MVSIGVIQYLDKLSIFKNFNLYGFLQGYYFGEVVRKTSVIWSLLRKNTGYFGTSLNMRGSYESQNGGGPQFLNVYMSLNTNNKSVQSFR